MKKEIILLSFALALLWGCKEEAFDYRPAEVSVDRITRLDFYTGTDRMIADGQARLDFIVDAYTTVESEDAEGNPTTLEVPINPRVLPEGAITIHRVGGGEVGWTYSTTDAAQGEVTFYAQAGSVKSAEKTVTLREVPELPEKRYVDIIFHVFELSPADPTYNPLSATTISYEELVASIEPLNAVFNNEQGTNANGASANIEFRLAATDPTGKKLAQPGCNRIVYTTTLVPNPASSPASYFNYMNGNEKQLTIVNPETGIGNVTVQVRGTSRVWDPTRYLNIVVCESSAGIISPSAAIVNPPPACQVVPADGEALEYVYNYRANAARFNRPWTVGAEPYADSYIKTYPKPRGDVVVLPLTADEQASAMNADNTCLLVPVSLFRPGLNRSVALSPYVGGYYGVGNTRFPDATADNDDHCEDTQNYVDGSSISNLSDLQKMSLIGEKFIANNATDELRYASLRNNFTLDQVARIRYTMDNCPGRQNTKTE